MSDPGPPTSYLAVANGTPVVSSDGVEIGTVAHVLADPDADMFDGIVVDVGHGHRFVDAPEVASLYEREVRLTIDAAAAASLPEPSANPGTLRVHGDEGAPGLSDRLRRAWQRISGNY